MSSKATSGPVTSPSGHAFASIGRTSASAIPASVKGDMIAPMASATSARLRGPAMDR